MRTCKKFTTEGIFFHLSQMLDVFWFREPIIKCIFPFFCESPIKVREMKRHVVNIDPFILLVSTMLLLPNLHNEALKERACTLGQKAE